MQHVYMRYCQVVVGCWSVVNLGYLVSRLVIVLEIVCSCGGMHASGWEGPNIRDANALDFKDMWDLRGLGCKLL